MNHLRVRAAAAALTLALAACVDGDLTTAVEAPRSVTLAVMPRFAVEPSASVVAALDRARLTLVDLEGDSALAIREQAIDPDLEEWTFEFTLQLLEDQLLDLRLDVELIDGDPTVDVVEYAGRTGFQVQASYEPAEIREINLGRGPLANLSLTSLRVHGARSRVQEGASDVLSVDTVGAAAGQIVFFESTDSTVASVDSTGHIRALVPGSTLVIARAGRVADTLSLTVGEVNLPGADELESRLLPQVEYVTGDLFLSSLADPGAGSELKEAIEALMGEMLAGRGFEAVGRFERAQALWEQYGSGTSLRFLDGPQLDVISITLMHAADALGIDFL